MPSLAEPCEPATRHHADSKPTRWRVQVRDRADKDRLHDHIAFASTEREAVRLLRRSIFSRATISRIAADLGWSPRAFQMRFRDVVGVSPAELRAWTRIDLALDRLHETPNVAATALASAVGLSSGAAIARLMHRLTGDSLQTWRTRIAFDLMQNGASRSSPHSRPTRG